MSSMSAKMSPHTQTSNLTIKQQYQPHQWPWNTSNNTNAATNTSNSTANNAVTSNNTATSVQQQQQSPPPQALNTLTFVSQAQQTMTTTAQQVTNQSTALPTQAGTVTVTTAAVNKLKRLQPSQVEQQQPGNGNVAPRVTTASIATNTIASSVAAAKRLRLGATTATVEKATSKSVGTSTAGLGGPPGLVAVGSASSATKKLTQMAIVTASNINHHQHHQHQQISSGTATTTTITKNTKNFTASGNADISNANKITAGRATTLKTTTASSSSTTTATAEAEAEITTTTELMTTTSTVLQQKSIIKTATVAASTAAAIKNANLEKYINLVQQQQQQQLATSIAPATTTVKKVERKTARIAPTVSLTRKVSHATQGGLGVGQPKKPVTIAPRTTDPKVNVQQLTAAAAMVATAAGPTAITATTSTVKQQLHEQQLAKTQQPTVLLTAIRIPQQQQQQTQQTQQQTTSQNQQTQTTTTTQSQGQTQQQQFKAVAQQQQPQISSPPRTPTKLGSTVFQFHSQPTAVMPNLVQIQNIVPTQAVVSTAAKLNATVTTASNSSPSTSLLMSNAATHGLTAARLNNGTTQLYMNGAVFKLHQVAQQQQQQQQQPQQQQQQSIAAVSQSITTSQANQLGIDTTAISMGMNGLLTTKPPGLSAAVSLSAATQQQQQHAKAFAVHAQQPAAQLFQQATAATAAAFAPQQLFMTPGGILLNAATIPAMLTSGLTASLQHTLTQAAQANIPALHPLQPAHSQQLPNITTIIQQQNAIQQQHHQSTQQSPAQNYHQLFTNLPQALLQATGKLGAGAITSPLYLNPSSTALTSGSSTITNGCSTSSPLTTPITISTSTIPSGSTTVAQPLSPPPLVATVPTFTTTSKPIMNTLNSQKIIIASATATNTTTKPAPGMKPITSTEPPKLVPVQLNKPAISITPVLSSNPPKLVTPSTAPVPKLVLSASVATKATSTSPSLKEISKPKMPLSQPPALAPAIPVVTPIVAAVPLSTIPTPKTSPRAIDNKSPPALNPLSLDCGSSNDSGIVANSSDTEDKSLTIDLCSPGTPDSTPRKKEEEEETRKASTPSPVPQTGPLLAPLLTTVVKPPICTDIPVLEGSGEPKIPIRSPSSPPPLSLLPPTIEPQQLAGITTTKTTVSVASSETEDSPKEDTSWASEEADTQKQSPEEKMDDNQPQESMSSDQDSTSQGILDETQTPSGDASESQRSTTPVDLSPPSIETDFFNATPPLEECAKSPILSQPKTIRFPAQNGFHHNFGRKGFRRLSDGRLFGVCYWNNCDAEFDSSSQLLDHLQAQHVNMQEGPFVCLWDGCKVHNKKSCSKHWLERHVLSHGGSKPHKCIVAGCGLRFGSQRALEKHVNNHFNNTESSNASKRSSELQLPKVLRKTGKKLRYRRQPWSARRFDFFDQGVMEGLQHRLILAGSVASARRGTVTFQGHAAGRRITGTGVEIFIKWFPREIISDEWIPEKDATTLTREISIHEMSPDQRFELEAHLKTNRQQNADLLSCLHELNLKLQSERRGTEYTSHNGGGGSSCSSSGSSYGCSSSSGCSSAASSSSSSSRSNSIISTPIPFNSRTEPKKLRKPPKQQQQPTEDGSLAMSSALSSSSSSLHSSVGGTGGSSPLNNNSSHNSNTLSGGSCTNISSSGGCGGRDSSSASSCASSTS